MAMNVNGLSLHRLLYLNSMATTDRPEETPWDPKTSQRFEKYASLLDLCHFRQRLPIDITLASVQENSSIHVKKLHRGV
jgi:hypothetical protein